MIGEYNRRVEIWKLTGGVDAANQPLPTAWVLHKRKWARVKGETGMGTIRAAASAEGINTPLDRYSFRVNYDRSITTGMQLRTPEGDRLNIVAVRHDMADKWWTDAVAELGGANG